MPPQSDQEVLFSVPLPLALAVFLALGLLIGAIVWLLTRRHLAGSRAVPSTFVSGAPWLLSMLEQLPCGVLLTNTQGQVELANGQACRWLGESGEAIELPSDVQSLVDRVVTSGVSEGLEAPAPSGEAQRLWIEASLLSENEAVLIVIRQSRTGGVDAEVYRRLMQTIGHELRTPLTAIMGHADILDSCSVEEEALWRRSQQFIASEVERLARLVEDLLALSRLDAVVSALVPVNLRVVAEEAISATWQPAEEKGVTLALQAATGLPRVQGDVDRLRQVFVNLLDNGVKYTPAGGQVTVRLVPDGNCVRTEVSDTGMGIPEADLPHIFDPLFRGDLASQTAPGTGLGLTIVRTILAQHGAEIRMQSELERGSTFSFDLPIAF
jgi:two-component system phosphate regulon sensor histidine kinase PhoR